MSIDRTVHGGSKFGIGGCLLVLFIVAAGVWEARPVVLWLLGTLLVYGICYGIAAPADKPTATASTSSREKSYKQALSATFTDLALSSCIALALLTLGLLFVNVFYLHEFEPAEYFKTARAVDSIRMWVEIHLSLRALYLFFALVPLLYLTRLFRPFSTEAEADIAYVANIAFRIAVILLCVVIAFPWVVSSQENRWVRDLSTMASVQADGIAYARRELIAQAYLQRHIEALSPQIKHDLARFVEVIPNQPEQKARDYFISLFSDCLCSSDTGFKEELLKIPAVSESRFDGIVYLAQSRDSAAGLSFQDVKSIFEGNDYINRKLWDGSSRLDSTFASLMLNSQPNSMDGKQFLLMHDFLGHLRTAYVRDIVPRKFNGIGDRISADDWIKTEQLRAYIESSKLDENVWNFGPCKAKARTEIDQAKHQ